MGSLYAVIHLHSSASVFNLVQAPFKRLPQCNVVLHQAVSRRRSVRQAFLPLMAYNRGCGRGRGNWRGGFSGFNKPEPFVLFPDVDLPGIKGVPEEKTLVIWNSRLKNYWKASPYYLEENVLKKSQSMDIERFSDWGKPKNTSKRDSLNQILQLQSHSFPKELIGDSRRVQQSAEKMRWNLDSGLEKLDMFEKLEQGFEGQDKGREKKGDGEEDNTDEEPGELSDESYSDDGDYNENEHFDDDEDDYNLEDDHDDEPIY